MFKPPIAYTNELAELFGILLGDGSVFPYYMRIYLNQKADKGYAQRIKTLIEKALPGVNISMAVKKNRGTEEVQVSSKDVCAYLYSIGFDPKKRTVPSWITQNDEFTKATIRGLFDTEGSIGCKHYSGKSGLRTYYQLTFTNRNVSLLTFIQEKLLYFGFRPTKTFRKNIYVSNRKDIIRYFQEIGTSNPKLEKKWKVIRMGGAT